MVITKIKNINFPYNWTERNESKEAKYQESIQTRRPHPTSTQCRAIQMAFRWRTDGRPLLEVAKHQKHHTQESQGGNPFPPGDHKNSEYDQEIPQSQTADNPWHREEEPLNHHETPGRQIKQSNQLSLPHQDDCNTRMDIK